MEEKTTRFEYVYRNLVDTIERGVLAPGDSLPSMHDLCLSYQVGINTVRDALHALSVDGYIILEERKRAVVADRAQGATCACACGLVARRDEVLDCFRALELIMPPLFYLASRYCTDAVGTSGQSADFLLLCQSRAHRPDPDHRRSREPVCTGDRRRGGRRSCGDVLVFEAARGA